MNHCNGHPVFHICHFYWPFYRKEKEIGLLSWFLGVSAEATTEKENEKEQNKPTTDCRHTHKISPWSGGLTISFYDFLAAARRENMF